MSNNMLEPDRNQIEVFVDAIFRHASAGVVSLRSFYEGEDKVFRIEPVRTVATKFHKYLCDVAEDLARRAAQNPKAVVFCPPLATFREKEGAGEADLVEGYTLSVECDENPEAARAKLEPLLGPVTVTVRSGGIWKSNGSAHDKVHLHWRLAKPATGKEQLAQLKRARLIACHLVGADPTTAPVCHPLRWPGSWHRKAEPRPCEIIAEASTLDHEIDLDTALKALEPFAPPPAPADANGAAGPSADWDEHVGNILRGEQLHKSLTELAMKLLVSGMGGRAAGNHLRALMRQSQAPRDERWQNRFDYIPRAVSSARKKLADETAEAARLAAEAAAQAQAVQAGTSTGNGAAPPPAAQPGAGGAGAPPPPPSWLSAGSQPGPGPQPQPAPPAQPPTIQLIEGELPRVIDEAEAALLADITRQQLYQRGELVVRPVRLKLRAADMQGHKRETSGWQLLQVTKPYMIETFTRVARFERWNERAKDWTAKNCPGWPRAQIFLRVHSSQSDSAESGEANMVPNNPVPPLSIIGAPEPSPPPRPLNAAGMELWNSIQREFTVTDSGGVELLLQSCALADRIAALAAEIERTGLMLPTKEGVRSNPLLKEEIGARSLLIRTLQKLGITDESIRPVGRPSHGKGRQHAY